MDRSDILVAKIGGSTLGAHDTTLEDIVALQRRGVRPVVVHGGGPLINEWLKAHGVPTRFERLLCPSKSMLPTSFPFENCCTLAGRFEAAVNAG
ncbi:MAG: hypothetical protein ACE1ZN_04955, partial [Dehalococcoidia bacterium]